MEDQERVKQLRQKRARTHELHEQMRLRSAYGEKLVAVIASATQKPLSLADFDEEQNKLMAIVWPTDLRDANGLVAAYISKPEASRLLACIRDRLGTINGKIGFHDKPYLGFAELHEVDPISLLLSSELTEDSVVFYCDDPAGVIMVDCYRSQPYEPFSVIVQGDNLVLELASCFPAKVIERKKTGPGSVPDHE